MERRPESFHWHRLRRWRCLTKNRILICAFLAEGFIAASNSGSLLFLLQDANENELFEFFMFPHIARAPAQHVTHSSFVDFFQPAWKRLHHGGVEVDVACPAVNFLCAKVKESVCRRHRSCAARPGAEPSEHLLPHRAAEVCPALLQWHLHLIRSYVFSVQILVAHDLPDFGCSAGDSDAMSRLCSDKMVRIKCSVSGSVTLVAAVGVKGITCSW